MGAPGQTVLYEVNIEVDAAAHEEYRRWLRSHIAEILALPGFTGARIFDVLDPPPSAGRIGLCVQYALKNQAALDDYLRDHAPRLRADGIARFGDRFQAARRVLRPARR
ncbi:MAG: DUF4286 family protein [Lysobacteraceae bacterium]|nr:MAG: DUF4286 family protein [Xanthomonadaceae bacterium]